MGGWGAKPKRMVVTKSTPQITIADEVESGAHFQWSDICWNIGEGAWMGVKIEE